MITGVFRRSSLPSRQTLSAAVNCFDSSLSHHFTSATTGASLVGNGSNLSSASSNIARDFHIRSNPSMASPARISFQGYATGTESSVAKIKTTPENVKPLSKKKKQGEESTSKIKGTRICIAIRSFDNPEKEAWCLPPHSRYAAMPDTRTLYTVLRSPHVDKKSREQFEMRFKKRFLVIKAQSHELSKKLFWLKRYRILGAQYELQFHCKTRLDMSPVLASINGSTIGGQ
ncbi:hypothetical protein Bca52824_026333 [Brassica carinata]|uniref:Small ribosomal subunit protein uS10 domain-containing protein n=1 Tax=Brassica carinata TaxID=52824 RepID=A0A8X7V7T6_BRACI|nr:hypothetical protein Bca52824_026333 [Brassica carinata]